MTLLHFVAAASGTIPQNPGGESATTPNPLLPNLAELVTGTLAFFIMFGLLAWKIFPKIAATYAERADKIEGGIRRAEEAQAEARAALEQHQRQLSEARHESSRLREEAQATRAQIVEEARAEARTEADRILARAQETIEAERQQAMVQLRAEVGRLAVELASRIVGESLEDEARRRGTVDRFLAELESGVAEPVVQGH